MENFKAEPNQPTKNDPVPSQRAVVTEAEIFNQVCPKCKAARMIPCKNKQGRLLAYELDSTELAFHSERILVSIQVQMNRKLEGTLSVADKVLIIYYAFIMLSESVSSKAEQMFGKKFSAEDVQAFFAQQAITELIRDRLIDPPYDPRRVS